MILEKNNHIARINAHEKLSAVEEELIGKGYTLGFLPHCNSQMTAEDYLVDQHNVNLQPIIATLEWRLPSGEIFINPKAPHSGAGPDLKYLLLKTGTNRKKQLGQLVQARFRVYPLEQLAAGVFIFPNQENGVQACRMIRNQWLNPYAMHLYPSQDFPFLNTDKDKVVKSQFLSESLVMLAFFVVHIHMQKVYLEKCRDICRANQCRVLSGKIAEQFFNERFSYSMLKNLYPQWPEDSRADRDTLQNISSRMKNALQFNSATKQSGGVQ